MNRPTQAPGAASASLFVIGLPRSLSSEIHELARAALDLASPRWTSAGEVLNTERWLTGAAESTHPRFVAPEHIALTECLHAFLDDVVRPRGHAYKDVVQPHAVASWLSVRKLSVLRVVRPVADVALSMLAARWTYPADPYPADSGTLEERLIVGLARAQTAQGRVTASELSFDDFVRDPDALAEALIRLYPERTGLTLPAHTREFTRQRDSILARRGTPAWTRLDRIAARLALPDSVHA